MDFNIDKRKKKKRREKENEKKTKKEKRKNEEKKEKIQCWNSFSDDDKSPNGVKDLLSSSPNLGQFLEGMRS